MAIRKALEAKPITGWIALLHPRRTARALNSQAQQLVATTRQRDDARELADRCLVQTEKAVTQAASALEHLAARERDLAAVQTQCRALDEELVKRYATLEHRGKSLREALYGKNEAQGAALRALSELWLMPTEGNRELVKELLPHAGMGLDLFLVYHAQRFNVDGSINSSTLKDD